MIKEATKNDLRGLLDLYQFLCPEENYSKTDESYPVWETITKNNENHKIFVFVEGSEIVSSCTIIIVPNLTRNRRPFALIENVITKPTRQKMGYGRKVMDKAITFARSRNCYKIMLLSAAHRKGAHTFYKKIGFNDHSKKGFHIRLEIEL